MDDGDSHYLHTVFAFAVGVGALMLASGAAASEIVHSVLRVTEFRPPDQPRWVAQRRRLRLRSPDSAQRMATVGPQTGSPCGSLCSGSRRDHLGVPTDLAVRGETSLEDVSADITYSEFRLSYQPGNDFPYTRIETIRGRTFEYGKLTKTYHLVERYCAGALTIEQAVAEVDAIRRSRGPYPWWLTRLATGLAGASAALIFGGGWLVVLAVFVANVILDYLLGVLGRHEWPSFYIQAIAGLVSVLAAIVVHLVNARIDSSRVA